MGLRTRTIVTLLAIVLPITFGFSYYRWTAEFRGFLEHRAERIALRIAANPQVYCEADDPGRWQARGYTVHTFGPGLSPELPAELVERFRAGEDVVHDFRARDDERRGVTLVRLAGDADLPDASHPTAPAVNGASTGDPACAAALVTWLHRDPPPHAPSIAGRVAMQTAMLMATLVLVGLLISAPLVYRLRRLNDAVRAASTSRFTNPERRARDEISELATTFGATLESLHARDAALKEYVANTTHDLAIPLTVLQHKLTALRNRLGSADAVAGEHLDTAIEESHYIASLIANMSAAARLEGQQDERTLAPVRLDEIVARVASRHRPIAEPRGIELNWSVPDEPIFTHGDATLLEQAVSNLVQNAVQYNAPGGHVGIILEHGPRAHPDRFELRVIDDGPGIAPDLRDRLHERGLRSDDARTRHTAGQGFGLAIAHQVCTRHGFTLKLGPHPDGGTEATIRGPLHAP